MFDVGSREAIPIDAWVDESANGVIAESADLELGSEIESEGDDKTERGDGDESLPDAVPPGTRRIRACTRGTGAAAESRV
jgi:hypothetical protein